MQHANQLKVTLGQLRTLLSEEKRAQDEFRTRREALAARGDVLCLVPVLGGEWVRNSYRARKATVSTNSTPPAAPAAPAAREPHESLLASIARLWRRRAETGASAAKNEHMARSKSSVAGKQEKCGKRSKSTASDRSAASEHLKDPGDVTLEDFEAPKSTENIKNLKNVKNIKNVKNDTESPPEKKRPARRLHPRSPEDQSRAYAAARTRAVAFVRARRADIAVEALDLGTTPGADVELRAELDEALGLRAGSGRGGV